MGILASWLLLAACGTIKPSATNSSTKTLCLLQSNKNPVEVGFSVFQESIAAFKQSKAAVEVLVVRITPGKTNSVCRRLVQIGPKWRLITNTEGSISYSVLLEPNPKVEELIGQASTGNYSVLAKSETAHTPLKIILLKQAGVTTASLDYEDIKCLSTQDQQKVQGLYDVAQYVLNLQFLL